ncbi:hypothetical protein ACLMJK_008806 [Lecanora helva]
MERKALNVVIVGGSIAGLMHGIMIKRLGHNVRILEKNVSSTRQSYAAGIAVGPQVQELLHKIDVLLETIAFHSPGLQILDKNLRVKRFIEQSVHLTSWEVLHSSLRARFDQYGMCESPHCIPEKDQEDGEVVYDLGKQVTNLVLNQGSIRLTSKDLINGGTEEIDADLTIAADGARSTIRDLLLPGLPDHYAGYVVWRGVIAEKDVSAETKNTFGTNTNIFALSKSRSYVVE